MASEKLKQFFNKRATKITLLVVFVVGFVVMIGYFVFGGGSLDQNIETNTKVTS